MLEIFSQGNCFRKLASKEESQTDLRFDDDFAYDRQIFIQLLPGRVESSHHPEYPIDSHQNHNRKMAQSSRVPSVDMGTFVPQRPIAETALIQEPYFNGQRQLSSFAAQPQNFTIDAKVSCEGNQFNGLSSPSNLLSAPPSDEHAGDMQSPNACEEFGYQYAYPQQGYAPYNPNFPGYYGFVNDPNCYYSGYASPVVNETQFQTYSGTNSAATSQYNGTQQFWQQPQMSENRYTRPQPRPRQVQRPCRQSLPVKVMENPSATLTEQEKADYKIFKEQWACQKGQQSARRFSPEQKEVFDRVLMDYSRYVGIPSFVNYILGEYDGNSLLPRRVPIHPILATGTVGTISQIRQTAAEFISYYESEEWDGTDGWSPKERISLLDVEALTVAQPKPSEPTSQGPITLIYVVLMHHLAQSEIKENEDSPTPCFETKGDILEIIRGEKQCKAQAMQPPVVSHKWRGEHPMCGFKKDNFGRSTPMIVRGRQDVSKMFQSIHQKMSSRQR